MRLLLRVRMGGKGAVYANGLTGFEASEGMTMTMTWTRGFIDTDSASTYALLVRKETKR